MDIKAVRTHIFKEGDDLASFVSKYVKQVPERSIIVIASKVVALAERRTVRHPGARQTIRLTLTDGMMMANAGIDESNADGKLILLPEDSYISAARLRKELTKAYRVKKLGVVISDSHIAPLRAGVTAHALGYAGIKGIRDYRGKKDLFGRRMNVSRTNVADSLATAAALAMGEGAERQPVALITGAPVEFVEKTDKNETRIDPEDDLYGPLLKGMKRSPVAPRGIGPRSRA